MACYAAQLEETLLFSNKTFNSPRLTYNTACNSYSLAIISFFGDKHNYAPHIVSGTSEWSFCFDTGKRKSTTEFKCVKRECNETEGLAFVFGCKRKARESNGKLRGFGQGDSRKRFKSWIAANRCVRGSQTPQMPLADNGGFVDIDQYPLPTILTRPTSMPNGPGSSAETSYSEGKIARLQNISMLTYTDGITAHVMYQAGRDMETQEEAIDSVTDSDSRPEEPQRENTPFPGHSIDKYMRATGYKNSAGATRVPSQGVSSAVSVSALDNGSSKDRAFIIVPSGSSRSDASGFLNSRFCHWFERYPMPQAAIAMGMNTGDLHIPELSRMLGTAFDDSKKRYPHSCDARCNREYEISARIISRMAQWKLLKRVVRSDDVLRRLESKMAASCCTLAAEFSKSKLRGTWLRRATFIALNQILSIFEDAVRVLGKAFREQLQDGEQVSPAHLKNLSNSIVIGRTSDNNAVKLQKHELERDNNRSTRNGTKAFTEDSSQKAANTRRPRESRLRTLSSPCIPETPLRENIVATAVTRPLSSLEPASIAQFPQSCLSQSSTHSAIGVDNSGRQESEVRTEYDGEPSPTNEFTPTCGDELCNGRCDECTTTTMLKMHKAGVIYLEMASHVITSLQKSTEMSPDLSTIKPIYRLDS
jgi:hypothetical protein